MILNSELLVVLRRVSGVPGLEFADGPAPLTGGFWAELVTFRLANAPIEWQGPLVTRVMPDAATAAKETVFQTEVATVGFATPAVRAAGGPSEGIGGRAFMVMDLAAGKPMLAGLDGIAAIRRLPALARRLPATLADVLADLHGLDPAPVVRRLASDDVARPGIDSMLDSMLDAATRLDRSDLAAAAAWLQNNRPPIEPTVICHGDMHPFNVLVDDAGATTVLDWSAATLAPATYDLAFTSLVLAEPPLMVPGPLRPLVRAAGRALSRQFLRAYERRTGSRVDPTSLAWYQGAVGVRALVEVAGWVAAGTIDERGGHPWVLAGQALADRLNLLTGARVTAR